MNILDIHILTKEEVANEPEVIVTVDERPDRYSFYHTPIETHGATAWLGVSEGFVHYFIHNPSNTGGAGGRTIVFNDNHGMTRTVKGPWSSRAGVMMPLYGIEIVDVTYTTAGATGGSSIGITLNVLKQALKEFAPAWRMVQKPSGRGEIIYVPRPQTMNWEYSGIKPREISLVPKVIRSLDEVAGTEV